MKKITNHFLEYRHKYPERKSECDLLANIFDQITDFVDGYKRIDNSISAIKGYILEYDNRSNEKKDQ